jgi:hypothetical protein
MELKALDVFRTYIKHVDQNLVPDSWGYRD